MVEAIVVAIFIATLLFIGVDYRRSTRRMSVSRAEAIATLVDVKRDGPPSEIIRIDEATAKLDQRIVQLQKLRRQQGVASQEVAEAPAEPRNLSTESAIVSSMEMKVAKVKLLAQETREKTRIRRRTP